MVIKGSRALKEKYHELIAGDIFIGIVPGKHLNQFFLIDLLERGIHCIPSALAQNLHRSKVAQTAVLCKWMLPHTQVVARRSELIKALNHFHCHDIAAAVTKQEHKHCGHGVRHWESLETLYNMMAFDPGSYPFVLQPFLEALIDVRVIIAGDYVEAYTRFNAHNFRKNLAAGGKVSIYALDDEKEQFCRAAMQRGKFPYAHMDLQITDSGAYYLGEIALNGGVKGAQISRSELERKKQALQEQIARGFGNQG